MDDGRGISVTDAGPWPATFSDGADATLAGWLSRFGGRTDEHAGRKPIVVGPARRRSDRVVRRRRVA